MSRLIVSGHRRRAGGRLAALLLAGLLLPAPHQASGQDRRVYDEAPVRQVIEDIEATSAYRFLYRDALITGKRVSFEADADALIASLEAALRPHGLHLQVDEARRQILLAEAPEAPAARPAVLSGEVLDDESGARLPFASITWLQDGRLRGVTTNEAGAFHLALDPLSGLDEVLLTASYVGYQPRRLRLDLRHPPAGLPFRLRPDERFGQEIVVSGTLLEADLDTTWRHLIRPGLFSPLGEGNVLRALQALPSVSLSTALTQGLNVRGSRADGFQVLLDGIPIYNQNHFFGLFDAFNEDALQAVGFYYGVTPARFEAPPGGTLSFVTRTGSQTGARQTLGLSNTSVKGTFEGPLWGGRGSWLVSGRHSYLNAIDWFNNASLIAQGLDVARRTSAPLLPAPGGNGRALFPGTSTARFYDLHGKLYYESAAGNRLMFNGYLGGDDTSHDEARRFFQRGQAGPDADRLELALVDTRNDWGNEAASLHDQRALGARAFVHSLLALSRYYARFSKDDFVYTRRLPPDSLPPEAPPRSFVDRFANDNELVAWKAEQRLDAATRAGGTLSGGYALHRFGITYEETSALRATYGQTRRSSQVDLFAQYEGTLAGGIDLEAGLRSHYFSLGRFLRLSPRLHVRLWPRRAASLSLGYSRNHQFLHRLYLEHANSTDVWIMSTAEEPPGSVDNVTAGLYLRALPGVFFQAEAYYKRYRNLRQHETSAVRRSVRQGSLVLEPWLHDNTARARGLELMLRHGLGRLLWTHTYTLSKMDVRNDALNDGVAFPADWDRRHQFATHLQGVLFGPLSWHLTWRFASGAPNTLAYTDPAEPARLPAYHRMDLSLQYRRAFRGFSMEATAAVFNLYDRDNTWYRSPVAVVDEAPPGRRLGFVNVDVYDLGFQPSFGVSVSF